MGMSVQPVKTQTVAPKQDLAKQKAIKGGIIGAVSGCAAGAVSSATMLPKVLSKDVFKTQVVENFKFPENTAQEVIDLTINQLKENVDEIYEPYKAAAEQARNLAKKGLPKAVLIALAVGSAVGAGVGLAIHHFKNQTPKTEKTTK